MELDNLTDQEKSVLLAKAQGWKVETPVLPTSIIMIDTPDRQEISNLYAPENMALAKRVFRWAYKRDIMPIGFALKILIGEGGWEWGLDVVLVAAIDAGIVKLEPNEEREC